MPADDLMGLLFIGDPHLASRVPGFRSDDYPRAILDKLKFALGYARDHRLLPVLLGDLFEFPRDNANWLLVELHRLLEKGTLAIHGNHDCKENELAENDSLSVLIASGQLRLLCDGHPWTGRINGCTVVVGGASWGQDVPASFDRSAYESEDPLFVVWATHHDLCFPGYEESARMKCRETPGIDLIVNGHIHRALGEVVSSTTRWINPGNISRISRGDATRAHVPGVLRVDVSAAGLETTRVAVPCLPFDEVFHADVQSAPVAAGPSLFIQELAKLQATRTSTGAGLREFLEANLSSFDPKVAAYVRVLAEEVLSDAP